MPPSRTRKPRPPLRPASLDELALSYVGRFATTRSKLRSYLARKLRERGWEGGSPPDVEAIAERFAATGLIDDTAFALAKAQSLGRRGYGRRRLTAALRVAGVEEEDSEAAYGEADRGAVAAALRFAQRRRLGPYAATSPQTPRDREKQVAAMVRAGHPLGLALAISRLEPGSEPDVEELGQHTRQ